MLHFKFSGYTFVFGLAMTSVFQVVIGKHEVETLNKLRHIVSDNIRVVENYNGGLIGVLPGGHSLNKMYQATEDAKTGIANQGPVENQARDAILDSYIGLEQELTRYFDTVAQKAPALNSAGVGFVLRGIFNSYKMKKHALEKAIESKFAKGYMHRALLSVDEANTALVDAVQAFSS